MWSTGSPRSSSRIPKPSRIPMCLIILVQVEKFHFCIHRGDAEDVAMDSLCTFCTANVRFLEIISRFLCNLSSSLRPLRPCGESSLVAAFGRAAPRCDTNAEFLVFSARFYRKFLISLRLCVRRFGYGSAALCLRGENEVFQGQPVYSQSEPTNSFLVAVFTP
jgi:hypothetical protein